MLGTDDLRSAAAMEIVRFLESEGAEINAYDPQAIPDSAKTLPTIQYCDDPYQCAKNSECLLIATA